VLTAWSVAGILGPIMVNAIADSQKAAAKSGPDLHTLSFWIVIGLLLVALMCNELVQTGRREVARTHPIPRARTGLRGEHTMTDQTADARLRDYRPTVPKAYIVMAWLWVTVPFAYGLFELP
jgi:hypothetical protein